MTLSDLRAEIDKRIDGANEEARDSAAVAMNSYGAGYDRGYADALIELRKFANGDEE